MKLKERLLQIRTTLKAPKSRWNKYGEFYSRSCEDILEALKPLLLEHKCLIHLTNDLEVFNGVTFRKSVATIECVDTDDTPISTHTYTQELITKKKMGPEQCSGCTSSYGDKYCLGKLLLIDDVKDSDTQEKETEKELLKEGLPEEPATESQQNKLVALLMKNRQGISTKRAEWIKAAPARQIDIEIIKWEKKLNEDDETRF